MRSYLPSCPLRVQEPDDDGIEDAFDLQAEIPEAVRTGIWVGDCFIYNNASWRLNYCVGGEVTTLHHLDKPMYLLGYLAAQSRVYLIDREFNVVSYTLLLSVVEYKTLVLRGDMETAAAVLESVPEVHYNTLAKFLEAKDMPELALEIATDPDYRFDLAVSLGQLELAIELAAAADSESKWRQLGELALAAGRLDVAEACFGKAKDLGGLLLLYTSRGDGAGMASLAATAKDDGKQNIAFACRLLLGDVDGCIDLLVECGRLPEAAFFARTYKPSRMTEIVKLWQADLVKINPKAAESLANPDEFPNLFPGLQEALVAERMLEAERAQRHPASAFPQMEGANLRNVMEAVQGMSLEDVPAAMPAPQANGDAYAHAAPLTQQPDGDLLGMDEPPLAQEEFATFAAAPVAPPEPSAPEPTAEEEDDEDDVFADAPEPQAAPAAVVVPDSGLTAEEEAMLEEDIDADLAAELAELGDEDVDLEDDWGIDDEDEKKD